jgi:putative SOS response-associated peptidase YedK
MCGRARLSSDVSEIRIAFGIPPERPTPNIAPSWNVAPTDPLPVVRYDTKDRQRSLDVMRWGLVPFWAKDIKVGFANINAKAEGIENKPAFREALRHRRCLVPVDNFYEWAKTPSCKQPYAIALKGGGLMALAGLWENCARRPENAYAASRSSPRSRTSSAPRCITGCRRSSRRRAGRTGSANNRPTKRG